MGEYMSCYVWAWVGMGGHRSLLMGMVWVWVQFKGKMLGSAIYTQELPGHLCKPALNITPQTEDINLYYITYKRSLEANL